MEFLIIFWVVIFFISLVVIIRGAEYTLLYFEIVGRSLGLSPFLMGVFLIGVSSSLPELSVSLFAIGKGVPEAIIPLSIGSSAANILFVLGCTTFFVKNIVFKKNFLVADYPFLVIAGTFLLFVLIPEEIIETGELKFAVNFFEALFLFCAYGLYLLYAILEKDESLEKMKSLIHVQKAVLRDYLFFIVGLSGLILGGAFLLSATKELAYLFNMGLNPGMLSISLLSLGMALPELLISYRAVKKNELDIVLGTIFGSNIFNLLFVVGFSGLFATLSINSHVFFVGIITLFASLLFLFLSLFSHKINRWEGVFYLLLYFLFFIKLFSIF